jgi:2-haloacid dehalogenase
MSRYKTLLLDVDNTVLDFSRAEHAAIVQTLTALGVAPTADVVALYTALNDVLWKRLERGELDRDQVIYGRFRILCDALGLTRDSRDCQAIYQHHLCQGHWYVPGARETLEALQGKVTIYLLTNGLATTQAPRLRDSGLLSLVQGIFISEEVGFQKPQKEFYDHCFARIPNFDRAAALMVGDSLTSDILGGNNAGVDTCWYNPHHAVNDRGVRVDYEIDRIEDLLQLI